MSREEFTDVSFNDLDPPRTRISRSSEFCVVNSTEIVLNIGRTKCIVIRETTDKIIVYARNTESDGCATRCARHFA